MIERPAVAEARELRIGMDEGFDVAGLEVGKRHDLTLVGAWTADLPVRAGEPEERIGRERASAAENARK